MLSNILEFLFTFLSFDAFLVPLLFSLLYFFILTILLLCLLTFFIFLYTQQTLVVASPTEKQLELNKLISTYEELITNRNEELHNLHTAVQQLENSILILERKAQVPQILTLVPNNLSYFLAFSAFFLSLFLINSLFRSEAQIITDANMQSAEALQGTLLRAISKIVSNSQTENSRLTQEGIETLLETLRDQFELSNILNIINLSEQLQILMKHLCDEDLDPTCAILSEIALISTKISALDAQISSLLPLLSGLIGSTADHLSNPALQDAVTGAFFS